MVLGMIAALYISVFNVLALLFNVIDFQFPDPLAYAGDPYASGIRFAVAWLIILFPTYLLITWHLDRDYRAHPEKRDFAVRKWLIYLTLFAAGIGVLVDLVMLINTFLGGEITTRFVLKAVAALAVAGGIFGYYITDLRRGAGTRIFMMASGAFVLLSIIGAFFIMGSPATQRDYRFDAQRIQHLQQLQWQIANHWQQKERLPAKLTDMQDAIQGIVIPTDPETDAAYEYRVVSARKFELCATFALPSRDLAGRGGYYPGGMGGGEPYYGSGGFDDAPYFKHEAGRQCFERTIDPDRFPPITKPLR